jgi:hypothetical protein
MFRDEGVIDIAGFVGDDLTTWINATEANQGGKALVERVGRLAFWAKPCPPGSPPSR